MWDAFTLLVRMAPRDVHPKKTSKERSAKAAHAKDLRHQYPPLSDIERGEVKGALLTLLKWAVADEHFPGALGGKASSSSTIVYC